MNMKLKMRGVRARLLKLKILFCGDSLVAEKDGTWRCLRGMNTSDAAILNLR